MTHLEYLLEAGILTGSRAFNCATEESDWDIVLTRKDVPDINSIEIISDTDFSNDPYDDMPDNAQKPGHYVTEYPELEDEGYVEYDQHTIWGPLERIIKYYSPDSEDIINLFIYSDSHNGILTKFIELNNLMNFLYSTECLHRDTRIEAFTKVIKHVGITNFKG